MEKLKTIQRYLKYYRKADTIYQVHSPFVYEFAEQVLEDDRDFYAFDIVEYLRNILKQNKDTISITDFGAGSKSSKSKNRTVGSIAKNAASRPWQCQTLFRLVNFYKPKTMVEIGTSLGISTLYQAMAALNAEFYTLEGDPIISKIAQHNFKELKMSQIQMVQGNFDKTIYPTLEKIKQLDYIFIDGNHRLEPTFRYFETALKYAHSESVFVIDDIHWSDEMERAWLKIKNHPQVTISIDLFHMGIVFFRKENREKEHFILAPLSWKPWGSGKLFK